MGVISLKPNENVFFPSPYQEDEVYPLVITSLRVIHINSQQAKKEIEIGKITYVGKSSQRPLMFPGLALIFLGLPGLVLGAYLFLSVLNLKGFEEGEEPPVDEQGEKVENPDITRIKGIAIGALGLLFMAGGVLLIRKKQHNVVCQVGKKAPMKLPVADQIAQTQVLMTLQAAITTQKAQAKAGAAQAPAAAKKA